MKLAALVMIAAAACGGKSRPPADPASTEEKPAAHESKNPKVVAFAKASRAIASAMGEVITAERPCGEPLPEGGLHLPVSPQVSIHDVGTRLGDDQQRVFYIEIGFTFILDEDSHELFPVQRALGQATVTGDDDASLNRAADEAGTIAGQKLSDAIHRMTCEVISRYSTGGAAAP